MLLLEPPRQRSMNRPVGTPSSSRRWIAHFHRNAQELLALPWSAPPILTPAERAAVLPSLREFQQGEALEAGHFFRAARAHAEHVGDPDYALAHRLFMAEEQRHGRDLARYLCQAGVTPLATQALRNRLFRWIGSRGGFEFTLRIILFVEVVAQVYYRAIRDATRCPLLCRLCTQILRDEHNHVRFQCDQLAKMRRGRSRWRLLMARQVDRMLCIGAVLVCWWGHAPGIRAGGFGLWRFWREVGARFHRALRLMSPGGSANRR